MGGEVTYLCLSSNHYTFDLHNLQGVNMGSGNRSFLTVAVILAILVLASITESGHASVWMQTVPTVAPSATQAPPVPINTQTPGPTATDTETPVVTNPTATHTVAVVSDTATPTATQSGEVVEPTATFTPTPLPGGGILTPEMLKIIYYLVCGLGLVAAISLIVILFIRRSPKPPAAPPAGPSA